MSVRVSEALIRDVVKALDALHALDDAVELEVMLDKPVRFYSDVARKFEFRIIPRFDDETWFEVVL